MDKLSLWDSETSNLVGEYGSLSDALRAVARAGDDSPEEAASLVLVDETATPPVAIAGGEELLTLAKLESYWDARAVTGEFAAVAQLPALGMEEPRAAVIWTTAGGIETVLEGQLGGDQFRRIDEARPAMQALMHAA